MTLLNCSESSESSSETVRPRMSDETARANSRSSSPPMRSSRPAAYHCARVPPAVRRPPARPPLVDDQLAESVAGNSARQAKHHSPTASRRLVCQTSRDKQRQVAQPTPTRRAASAVRAMSLGPECGSLGCRVPHRVMLGHRAVECQAVVGETPRRTHVTTTSAAPRRTLAAAREAFATRRHQSMSGASLTSNHHLADYPPRHAKMLERHKFPRRTSRRSGSRDFNRRPSHSAARCLCFADRSWRDARLQRHDRYGARHLSAAESQRQRPAPSGRGRGNDQRHDCGARLRVAGV